ncbi:MAG TPA: glucose 1-dehydrogenase [Mycobacteriales bacterium]|nr:glucose 1-dehydrogenase [Mycobacteriales bacterium]
MRAWTVRPGEAGSAAIRDIDTAPGTGDVVVETIAVGVCGTDKEITSGEYGEAPAGDDVLVLGHESLGRVVEAPSDSHLAPGDLVVGIVRRPDPVPCANCAVGEWDMCRNGQYTERGIKGAHGYGAEQYRIESDFAVPLAPSLAEVGVLLEPTTVVAKAWEHIEYIGRRAHWEPKTVVVTGAGPIGLLAALLGVQRGLEVHVTDIVTTGPKPKLVADLGGTYHAKPASEIGLAPDIVIECTGVAPVIEDALTLSGNDGVTCLTGVSSSGRQRTIDLGGFNREVVLQNDTVFGSVNANRRHYEAAAAALADADVDWLGRLITRRVPIDRFADGLDRRPDDVKVILEFQAG